MTDKPPGEYERFDLPPRPHDAVPGDVWMAAPGPGRPVSITEAVVLAEEAMSRNAPERMAVLSVAEAEFGWVFALQGIRYIETREFSDQLIGHGVTIVDRLTGAVYCSGSATPPWDAILKVLELRSAAERQLESPVANPGFIRPPPVYLLAVLVGFGLERLRPLPLPAGSLGRLLGVLAVAVGMVLFVLTQRAFRSAGTPVPGNQPATAVVRTGPMGFSRNPIYLAFSLMQLGMALWLRSGWILILLGPPVALMQLLVIPREERYMEAKFGAEYVAYKSSVHRWL